MFDSNNHQEFFDALKEEGYHIYSRENGEGFYPNTFPPYPKLKYSDMVEGAMITIRAFFTFTVGGGGEFPVLNHFLKEPFKWIINRLRSSWMSTIMPRPRNHSIPSHLVR